MKLEISPKRDRKDLLDALHKATQFNKIYLFSKILSPNYAALQKRQRQNKRFKQLKEKIEAGRE